MEEIIYLILFTYPGALADFIHSIWAKGSVFQKETDSYFRAARDFFLSALATITSITIFRWISGSAFDLGSITEKLQAGNAIWVYLVISMAVSVFIAGIWHGVERLRFHVVNDTKKKNGKAYVDINKTVWGALTKDKDIPYRDCVLAIFQGDTLLRAGLPYNVSYTGENDPWIALSYTDSMTEIFVDQKKREKLMSSSAVSYVNLENGISVNLYYNNGASDEAVRMFNASFLSLDSNDQVSEAQEQG